jgi:hypothetical protein
MIFVGVAGFIAGVVATFVGSTAFVYTQFDDSEELISQTKSHQL